MSPTLSFNLPSIVPSSVRELKARIYVSSMCEHTAVAPSQLQVCDYHARGGRQPGSVIAGPTDLDAAVRAHAAIASAFGGMWSCCCCGGGDRGLIRKINGPVSSRLSEARLSDYSSWLYEFVIYVLEGSGELSLFWRNASLFPLL